VDLIINLLVLRAAGLSVALVMRATYTLHIMLYTWDQPEAYRKAKAPESFLTPKLMFTVIAPPMTTAPSPRPGKRRPSFPPRVSTTCAS